MNCATASERRRLVQNAFSPDVVLQECCKESETEVKDNSDTFEHLWRLGFLARRRRVACARGTIVGVAEERYFTGANGPQVQGGPVENRNEKH